MIPRLSGRSGQRNAAPESRHADASLPSKDEAARIIRQFFALIERFRLPDEDRAPEMKASIGKRAGRRRRTRQRNDEGAA